jgi:hypothetical protein
MFYIPNFDNIDDLLEYENKFLEKYKKSINSSAFTQMSAIKEEINIRKKELLKKDLENNHDTFDNIINIG